MVPNFSNNRLLVYCVFLVLTIAPIGATLQQCVKDEDCRDKKGIIRSLRTFSDLSCDFENDCSNWIDESEGGFYWDIQNYDSTSWGKESLAPPDVSNEKKYMRVHRWVSSSTLSTFGVAILRSQPFTFLPDEDAQFSFSFWILLKWPKFNNLQVRYNNCFYYSLNQFLSFRIPVVFVHKWEGEVTVGSFQLFANHKQKVAPISSHLPDGLR